MHEFPVRCQSQFVVWTFAFAVWHDAYCDEQKDEEECMSFRWGGIVQLVVQTGSVLWPHTRQ